MTAVKLTYNGMTRRAVFQDEHPPWEDLTQRAESLFKIPAGEVGLSYVDPDGDRMYLASHDELFDMYHTEPSQPQTHPPTYKFTVHDMREAPGKHRSEHGAGADDDSSSSSSSSSVSDAGESSAVPNLGDRGASRGMGLGLGGMGIGFAPFEMMFGPAATAASVKSPSQGHLSPVPTASELGFAAAEAGQNRSQFGRSVASSVSGMEDPNNPTIHIQQPSTDAGSVTTEHPEPLYTTHPTPALYLDVAHFIHALSDAVGTNPAVSATFSHILANAHSGIYWDEVAPPPEMQQASTHNLLGAITSLLHALIPPPPPRTPTQVAVTPAYTAAQFELPDSVIADETPIPSRLNTPSVAPIPFVASPAMTATSIPSTVQGPSIRPVLDMARADRASVRSDTDAGSVVSGSGMGSPIGDIGPSWRFAGRTGPAVPAGAPWRPHPALNTNTGAMVPMQADGQPEATKYVESRVKLEHMKEMYKQTKEEYRREREERKREREARKQGRLLVGPPEPIPPPMHGDMFDKLNEALAQVPGRAGSGPEQGRKGIIPPPAASVIGSTITNETAVRTRQQLNNWLIEQLGDMGFSAATHPQVNRMVRDATRPYASNAETANENALLEELLAQLVPTGSKS